MSSNTLIDVIDFNPRLIESEGGPAKIEGVFQRCDTKNANGRVYPRKIWERLLKEGSPVRERIKGRSMIGHLEHPADGTTDLRKGAVLITGLRLDEKNQVIGTAELLDTPDGKIAQAYVKSDVRIGISSRGKGSVDNRGQVSEDYKLETFDLVYNPSTPGAHPRSVSEDISDQHGQNDLPEDKKKEQAMSLTEATARIRGLESEVSNLVEQDLNGMPNYQLTDLSGRLLEASVSLGELAANNAAIGGVAKGLQERIGEKREEISRLLGGKSAADYTFAKGGAGSNDDGRLHENNGADDDDISALLEAVNDEEDLDDDDADEEIDEATEIVVEALRTRCADAEEALAITEEKLEAALALLSALTEHSQDDEIEEAIAEALEDNPALESVIAILAEAESADEVFDKAALLSESIHEDADEDEEDEEDEDDEDEDVDESFDDEIDDDDLFEALEGIGLNESLQSEDDVSSGLLEEDRSGRRESKGASLARHAVSRVNGR